MIIQTYEPIRHNRAPDPTPAEIEERCAEVRAGWSESERARRAGHIVEPLGCRMLVSSCRHNNDSINDQLIMVSESREQQSAELARA